MDANNQIPNIAPTPEAPLAPQRPEAPVTPEAGKPESPNLPEISREEPGTGKTVEIPQAPAPEVVQMVEPSSAPATEIMESEMVNEGKLDEKYFTTANEVIKETKGKPFEQEEKAEDQQIGYLKERFGKEIKKSED